MYLEGSGGRLFPSRRCQTGTVDCDHVCLGLFFIDKAAFSGIPKEQLEFSGVFPCSTSQKSWVQKSSALAFHAPPLAPEFRLRDFRLGHGAVFNAYRWN